MRNDLTDLTIILDRSGSMDAVREEAEDAVNEYLNGQKSGPGECRVSVVLFDDQYETPITATPIQDCPRVKLEPRSSTALRDAIGRTINRTGERLRDIPEAERPGLVLIVVQTDGKENASQEFSPEDIRRMIKRQEEDYNWQFVFLGANQDAILEAGRLGIQGSKAMNYANTGKGYDNMYKTVSKSTHKLRAARASGQSLAQYQVDDDDRMQVENPETT